MIGLLTSSLNRLQATAQVAGDFSAWRSLLRQALFARAYAAV